MLSAGLRGPGQICSISLSPFPSQSFVTCSATAARDDVHKKGRGPTRMQPCLTPTLLPSASKKWKGRKRGREEKNPQEEKTGIKLSTEEMSTEVKGDEKMKSYFFFSFLTSLVSLTDNIRSLGAKLPLAPAVEIPKGLVFFFLFYKPIFVPLFLAGRN